MECAPAMKIMFRAQGHLGEPGAKEPGGMKSAGLLRND